MINVKDLLYQTRMLGDLRRRYKKERNSYEKTKLERIGKSRRKLLEEQYAEYRKQIIEEIKADDFERMVIDILITIP